MKNTYLVYKEIDGSRQLVTATQQEWDAIMKANKGLPIEERRCFIKDRIMDGNEMDFMYIETTTAEFREWNNRDRISRRKHRRSPKYLKVSMDVEAEGTGYDSLHDAVPSEFNLEEHAIDEILFEKLREALRNWKPWAEEMLEIYLAGENRTSNSFLCDKYKITKRAIQKRKQSFEKFVLDFLKK